MATDTQDTQTAGKTPATKLKPLKQDISGDYPCPSEEENLKEHAGYLFDPYHPRHRAKRCQHIRRIAQLVGYNGQPYTNEKHMTARLLKQIKKKLNLDTNTTSCANIITATLNELGIETQQEYFNDNRKIGTEELEKLEKKLETRLQ